VFRFLAHVHPKHATEPTEKEKSLEAFNKCTVIQYSIPGRFELEQVTSLRWQVTSLHWHSNDSLTTAAISDMCTRF